MKAIVLAVSLVGVAVNAMAGDVKPPPRGPVPLATLPIYHQQWTPPVTVPSNERWIRFSVGKTDYLTVNTPTSRQLYRQTWRLGGRRPVDFTPVNTPVDCMHATGSDLTACSKAATL